VHRAPRSGGAKGRDKGSASPCVARYARAAEVQRARYGASRRRRAGQQHLNERNGEYDGAGRAVHGRTK
jgi:hypothetical protein